MCWWLIIVLCLLRLLMILVEFVLNTLEVSLGVGQCTVIVHGARVSLGGHLGSDGLNLLSMADVLLRLLVEEGKAFVRAEGDQFT
jgi:hypothetical protein